MKRLQTGEQRLLEHASLVDDRGLEFAEAILHDRRYHDQLTGHTDTRVMRALTAVENLRQLTKPR